ncbi:MAG TPA: cupin domain-containing protein [Rhodocyclaceae bacterium]|nr:cupin domain-containing protein [Rhodocyclaceae bacterium]HMV53721.1 cupin domain-containing protein [Rhodocyclaceae bacterium]HNA05201.1 cupin domain-containing protein [Rhodocyclaceae bacterium]HNB78002.1 cupin domain-containing protein [Rhodocyclaceae bacterium]HNC62414.1 cupin domain-containing protein [Rhodocyclaceae bacterium]
MYQTAMNEEEVGWEPTGLAGVSLRRLSGDAATGASVALYKFEPGATVPAHWHSAADETGYVLSGDFIENGMPFGPGTVLYGKAGTLHGPHHTKSGCIVLFTLSSQLDFNVAHAESD